MVYKFKEDPTYVQNYFEEFCDLHEVSKGANRKRVVIKSVLSGKPVPTIGADNSPCYQLCRRHEHSSNTSCEGARGIFCAFQQVDERSKINKSFNFLPAMVQMKGTLETYGKDPVIVAILGKRLEYFNYYLFVNAYTEYKTLTTLQQKTFNDYLDFSKINIWQLSEPFISIAEMATDPWNVFIKQKKKEEQKELFDVNILNTNRPAANGSCG